MFDSVEIVYELLLLPNNKEVEHFYKKTHAVQGVSWICITGVLD